jgi:hypothetical protein
MAEAERQKRWRLAHPERVNAMSRRWRAGVRLDVLSHYSGGRPACALCGFSDTRALDIDHIGGGGRAHRKEINREDLYPWLKSRGCPSGYRVLCRNCNQIVYIESKEVL